MVALSHPVAFALVAPCASNLPRCPSELGRQRRRPGAGRGSGDVGVNPGNRDEHRQRMADFLGARYRGFSRPGELAAPEATHLPLSRIFRIYR